MQGFYDETIHLRGRKAFKNKVLTQNATSTKKVESDFATKMMESMGWSDGKGLGANEDGRTDIIQAERRDNGLGLGLKHKEDNWNDEWWMNIYSGAMGTKKTNLKTFKAKDTPEISRRSSFVVTRSQSRNISRKTSAINLEDFLEGDEKISKKKKKSKKTVAEPELEIVKEKKKKNKKNKEKVVESKPVMPLDSDDESGSDYDSDEEEKFKNLSKKIFKTKRT